MSRFTGPSFRGARRVVRQLKRTQAEQRNAATPAERCRAARQSSDGTAGPSPQAAVQAGAALPPGGARHPSSPPQPVSKQAATGPAAAPGGARTSSGGAADQAPGGEAR